MKVKLASVSIAVTQYGAICLAAVDFNGVVWTKYDSYPWRKEPMPYVESPVEG